jgi:hypothetical protein
MCFSGNPKNAKSPVAEFDAEEAERIHARELINTLAIDY